MQVGVVGEVDDGWGAVLAELVRRGHQVVTTDGPAPAADVVLVVDPPAGGVEARGAPSVLALDAVGTLAAAGSPARLRGAAAVVCSTPAGSDLLAASARVRSLVVPRCWADPGVDAFAQERLDTAGVQTGAYVAVGGERLAASDAGAVAETLLALDGTEPVVVLGSLDLSSPVTSRLADLAGHPRLRFVPDVGGRRGLATWLGRASCHVHVDVIGGGDDGIVEAIGAGAAIVARSSPSNLALLGAAARYYRDTGPDLCAAVTTARIDADVLRVQTRDLRDRSYSSGAIPDAYERILGAVVAGETLALAPWSSNGDSSASGAATDVA